MMALLVNLFTVVLASLFKLSQLSVCLSVCHFLSFFLSFFLNIITVGKALVRNPPLKKITTCVLI